MTTRKRLLPVASGLFLVGLAILVMPQSLHLVPSVEGSSKTIHLVGTLVGGYAYYWNNTNPTITVTQGDMITIILSSADGAPHRFLLDLDLDGVSDTADCSATPTSTMDPCSTTFSTTTPMVTFTASSPGTFSYYCTIHYPQMMGSFIVQASPSPEFTITSSPSSLSFLQGSSGTSTITLTSQNGFSGTVSLSATVSPAGPTASLNPTSVTISSGTPMTSILSVNSTASTPSGSYTVTISGTSGTLSHTTTISVAVNASNSPPLGSLNLPLTVLAGAAVVIAAAVAVAVFLVRRKAK